MFNIVMRTIDYLNWISSDLVTESLSDKLNISNIF